jgi:hypothetical protein
MEFEDRGDFVTCVIRSEEQAWDLFNRAKKGEFSKKPLIPSFDGWPNQEITFWRDGEHEVLTVPMMEALIDYQQGLYRSFLLLEEDTSNLRRLSEEYRRRYEVKFHVGEGCTKLIPDLSEALKKFAETAAAHMSGQQLTITILGIALIWGSVAAWRAWLNNKAKQASEEAKNETTREFLSTQRFATSQETKRLEMLTRALEKATGSRALVEASDEAKAGVLRAATRVDETEVADVVLEPEAARKISRLTRTEPELRVIEGTFEVLRNDAEPRTPFRVKIRDTDTGEEFFARIRDALVAGDDRRIISEAEWTHRPFWARIEVKRNRGRITEATIVQVLPRAA